MPLARRRPRTLGLFAVERPPRLVLRFAVVLSVALALAAALILVVVRSFTVTQAERAATKQASLVASTLLRTEVVPRDFAGRVPPERQHELDELFDDHSVALGTLGVSLVRPDGLVTYSTDHELIGSRGRRALATEAAGGTIVSRTSDGRTAGASEGTRSSRRSRRSEEPRETGAPQPSSSRTSRSSGMRSARCSGSAASSKGFSSCSSSCSCRSLPA